MGYLYVNYDLIKLINIKPLSMYFLLKGFPVLLIMK